MNHPVALHINFQICLQFFLLVWSHHYALRHTTEKILEHH